MHEHVFLGNVENRFWKTIVILWNWISCVDALNVVSFIILENKPMKMHNIPHQRPVNFLLNQAAVLRQLFSLQFLCLVQLYNCFNSLFMILFSWICNQRKYSQHLFFSRRKLFMFFVFFPRLVFILF